MLVVVGGILPLNCLTVALLADASSTQLNKGDEMKSRPQVEENDPTKNNSRKPATKDSKNKVEDKKDKTKPKLKQAPSVSPKIKPIELDIHEHQCLLPNSIWYKPTSKPVVSISIVFKDAGSKNENNEHPSLETFVGEMICKGAGNYDRYQYEKAVRDCSATINFSIGLDDAELNIWVPVKTYKDAIRLALLTLLRPRLPRQVLEKLKKESLADFEESLAYPETHLTEEFNKLFYPENHPYRVSLEKVKRDIRKICTKDIKNYLKILSQKIAYVVVSGPKEEEAEIVAFLEKELMQLPKEGTPVICGTFQENPNVKSQHIEFDVPQSLIAARAPGFNSSDPWYFAKQLAMAIVAYPSLRSLIFREIREKHGLAYSCYGINKELSLNSSINFFIGTRNETALAACDALKKLLARINTGGITRDDFEITKNEQLGYTTVRFDSSAKIVGFIMQKRLLGFSIDQVKTYAKNYENVTYDNVNNASKQLFDPNKLVFVSVGKKQLVHGEKM
jgi:zinc protease